MSDNVWISGALTDPRFMKSFEIDFDKYEKEVILNVNRKQKRGEKVDAKDFPGELYSGNPKKIGKQQDLFFANSFWCVSGAAEKVLRKFNLGENELYTVKIYQYNRKIEVEGEYFILNFGERKDAFVPEHSSGVEKPWVDKDDWWPPSLINDRDIAVTTDALIGADLWTDSRLRKAFFVSDRLAKALGEQKLTGKFKLRKCEIVDYRSD